MPVQYTFGSATTAIPLSQLDTNFATPITLGNTAVQLGNTVTTLNNLTLANVTISSGNVTITNVSVTTANATTANIGTLIVTGNETAFNNITAASANVSGTANVSTLAVIANTTVGGNVSVTGNVSMNVATITTSNVTTENVSSLIVTGNQTFVGTGNRITGDFSNATVTNRAIFQSSTVNGSTGVTAIPNGTNNVAGFLALPYSSIIGNASSYGQFSCSTTEVKVDAGTLPGGGSYLPITFYTGGNERMRVDTSGNLLVGATSITSGWKFVVNGSQYTAGSISSTGGDPNFSAGGSRAFIDWDGTKARIGTLAGGSTGGPTAFFVNGTEYMRIDSSGKVGIGTSSPVSKLDAYGTAGITSFTGTSPMAITTQGATSTNDYSGIDFTQNGNAPRARIASYFSGLGSYLQFGTSNSYASGITNTAMTIDYSGNVGIGTASPSGYRLNVNGNYYCSSGVDITPNTNFGSQFVIGGNGYTGGIALDATGMWIGQNSGSRALIFVGGNNGTTVTERMRIDSSGNVLVTNPAGLGYGTGSGGTVTQATSKATNITLNKPTGLITTSNSALAAGAEIIFTVNNSLVAVTDTVILNPSNNGTVTGNAYETKVGIVAAGLFSIKLKNTTAGSLSEAVPINFAIIKGATA